MRFTGSQSRSERGSETRSQQYINGAADTAVPAALSRQSVALGYGCATRCAVTFGNFVVVRMRSVKF